MIAKGGKLLIFPSRKRGMSILYRMRICQEIKAGRYIPKGPAQ